MIRHLALECLFKLASFQYDQEPSDPAQYQRWYDQQHEHNVVVDDSSGHSEILSPREPYYVRVAAAIHPDLSLTIQLISNISKSLTEGLDTWDEERVELYLDMIEDLADFAEDVFDLEPLEEDLREVYAVTKRRRPSKSTDYRKYRQYWRKNRQKYRQKKRKQRLDYRKNKNKIKRRRKLLKNRPKGRVRKPQAF
jgi:hypothetical protein